MPQTARIFVSHNSQDAKWCHTFVAALRQTEVDVWYDEHNLGYGQLMTEIERELRTRPIFIVVLSPTAVASKWVQREVSAAIDLADHDAQSSCRPCATSPPEAHRRRPSPRRSLPVRLAAQ